MFEYIIDAGLQPVRPYVKRKKTDMIILHHAAGESSVQAMHQYHIRVRKYRGIAYNIYIDLDGKAYWGRGLEYCGGGVQDSGVTAGINQRCVAIICNGNFETRTMPDFQRAMLLRVLRDLLSYYPGITLIAGHKEVAAPGHTQCPGKYFPLDEAKFAKSETKPPAASKPSAGTAFTFSQSDLVSRTRHDRNMLAVTAIQTALTRAGFSLGTIDGIFGPKTEAAVKAFQRARGLKVDGIVGKATVAALGGVWIGK